MSLQGEKTSFISLGLACQASMQLYENRQRVSSLVCEPVKYRSSFFNWLMISADEIPRLLERMTTPIEVESFGLPAGEKVPVLIGYRTWMFHDGPNHEYTAQKLIDLASKYEHLRQNFLDLCTRPIRHFVLSNAQNNLAPVHPHLSDCMSITVDDKLASSIKNTLDKLFPSGENYLLIVGRHDRLDQPMNHPVRIPPLDETLWEGDPVAWAAILEVHLSSSRR